MHIRELIDDRFVPAKGVYLAITRRCPLSCAHCSTSSAMDSEEQADEPLISFVSTFTEADRPEYTIVTGGEPLLRPSLIEKFGTLIHNVEAKLVVGTGLFFALDGILNRRVENALRSVDHLIISIDEFHEVQLPRGNVYRTIHKLRDLGISLSVQTTRRGDNDQFAASLIASLRSEFGDAVPIVVTQLQNVGRAKDLGLIGDLSSNSTAPFEPCILATWPVVGFSGDIVACTNQVTVDGPRPSHLFLGHVSTSRWTEIRKAIEERHLLRAIRTVGPRNILQTQRKSDCIGYCTACRAIESDKRANSTRFNDSSLQQLEQLVQHVMAPQKINDLLQPYVELTYLGYDAHK